MAISSTIEVSPNSWTWEKARHLLFRAGFGGKKEEIEEVFKIGLFKTFDQLFSGPTRPFPIPGWLEEDKSFDPRSLKRASKEERQMAQMRNRPHARELIGG